MSNLEAARLSELLQAAAKQQGLRGSDLSREVELLTGRPYPQVYVWRRMNGVRPMVTIHPDLYALCVALRLDPVETLAEAVRTRKQAGK